MSSIVADTQSIIWYMFNSTRLSNTAFTALSNTVKNGDSIYVSTITLIEVTYLMEKNKIPPNTLQRLIDILADPNVAIEPVPLSLEIAQIFRQIPRDVVPEMPDRIIAAMALHLNLPLVTSDLKIRALSQVQTIWD